MTFLVNSFLYVPTAAAAWYVTMSVGGGDISDELAINSSGTVTIPSAWNGRKVRASIGGTASGGADITLTISKNSADFDGMAEASFPNVSSTDEAGTAHTAPVEVATSDTFTFSGGSNTNGSWRGVELLPSGVKGALVNRVTSAFALSGATIVDWNNEVYDTDAFHDNSTNPSRLTVQSGTSGLVRIQSNIKTSGALSQIFIEILKNGSVIYEHESTNQEINIFSPPIPVSAGDYFQIRVTPNTAVNVNVDGASWMSLEELPSGLQYCIGSAGNSSTLPTGAVWTQHTGFAESVDVGGWHSGSSQFVVPSGTTGRVRVGFFGGSNTGLANAVEQTFFLNGAQFEQAPHSNQNSTGNEFRHAASTIIEVSAGDTFTFYLRTGAGSQTGYGTYWIEEVPEVT